VSWRLDLSANLSTSVAFIRISTTATAEGAFGSVRREPPRFDFRILR
jgi:hypothetical protein